MTKERDLPPQEDVEEAADKSTGKVLNMVLGDDRNEPVTGTLLEVKLRAYIVSFRNGTRNKTVVAHYIELREGWLSLYKEDSLVYGTPSDRVKEVTEIETNDD